MDPKQNEKLRKVQASYRKKKIRYRSKGDVSRTWTLAVGAGVLIMFFLLIMSVLFDIGVPLPSFFGR
ncbi:hypothetical protein [Rossellomorea aquimaris]|uniref:Uncharacterized protein n=1 Tax=Rossellomorea aquimaris TaxID=189382 RepID=A0A1J6W2G1_9BACI|nr:hypothetical protein [Rossellomorea aquimaris]OIU71781.1 hypothetical protein BHE18_03745 [Rossellomorea aquimaris]